MATIQDIAQISGYSIGTVSRVINNRSGVSKDAKRKNEEVIREQDYQPNSNARMLRQSVSSEVSIIVRGINSPFLHSILEKVQNRLNEYGESANVLFIGENEGEVATAVQVMQNLKPKGLIFLGGNTDTFRKAFDKVDVPSVLIAADGEGLGYDNLSSFTTDDVDASSCAVRALISQGHRRIGILGGYPGDAKGERDSDNPATLRIRGAVEELKRSGVAFDCERDYEECTFSAEGGFQGAKRLLQRTPDLTGIFAISDSVAIGALRALQDMNLRVPEDISMVGFDGIVMTQYSVPRLATIRQDTEMLVREGVDDLLRRITYELPAVHEKIPYQYVNGESVARPRERKGR